MNPKKPNNNAKRLLILFVAGGLIIFFAIANQDPIHNFIYKTTSNDIRKICKKFSSVIYDYDINPYELTKELNNELESDGRQQQFFGISEEYRFNFSNLKKYMGWISETIEKSKIEKSYALIIDKSAYTLFLYKNGEKVNSFPIELGSNPVDDKFLEGDRCTPEGKYRIVSVRDKGQTQFHRAYLLNYPNSQDKKELWSYKLKGKVPIFSSAGRLIEIHGKGSGKKGSKGGNNWTLGCISVSNADMDDLFKYGISAGTVVTIVRYGTQVQ